MAEPLTVGSTYDWHLYQAKKDGVVWDLSGATVTLYLKSPAGAVASFGASPYDAANGRAKYVGVGTELTAAGTWHRVWRVVKGAIDVRSPPIPFVVKAAFS